MPLHNQEAFGINFPLWQETRVRGPSSAHADQAHPKQTVPITVYCRASSFLSKGQMWKITRPDIACYSSTSEIQGGGHPALIQMGNAQVGKYIKCSVGVYKDLIVFWKSTFLSEVLKQ